MARRRHGRDDGSVQRTGRPRPPGSACVRRSPGASSRTPRRHPGRPPHHRLRRRPLRARQGRRERLRGRPESLRRPRRVVRGPRRRSPEHANVFVRLARTPAEAVVLQNRSGSRSSTRSVLRSRRRRPPRARYVQAGDVALTLAPSTAVELDFADAALEAEGRKLRVGRVSSELAGDPAIVALHALAPFGATLKPAAAVAITLPAAAASRTVRGRLRWPSTTRWTAPTSVGSASWPRPRSRAASRRAIPAPGSRASRGSASGRRPSEPRTALSMHHARGARSRDARRLLEHPRRRRPRATRTVRAAHRHRRAGPGRRSAAPDGADGGAWGPSKCPALPAGKSVGLATGEQLAKLTREGLRRQRLLARERLRLGSPRGCSSPTAGARTARASRRTPRPRSRATPARTSPP